MPNGSARQPEAPHALSGKKQALPIKKRLLGQPLETVIHREAMAKPGCLDWCAALVAAHLARAPG